MTAADLKPRLDIVDALRGFALMGIFLVHMVEYFELYWYNPEPGMVHESIFFLFGGKAYAVFAMLFGLSFFIIMDRNEKRNIDFRVRFVWRMVLLWVMGYLTSLIYSGEILQILAVAGLFLFLMYKLNNKVVLILSLLMTLQAPLIVWLFISLFDPASATAQPMFWSLMGSNFEVFAKESFMGVLSYNVWDGQWGKWMFFIETGRLWSLMGLLMWGLLLGRLRFFENTGQYLRHSSIALVFALIAAITLHFFRETMTSAIAPGMSQLIFINILENYLNLVITCIGMLGFIILYQSNAIAGVLKLLAPCGRMSLTIYISQSLIFTPLFYGYGLGWYATIGQAMSLMLAFVFWIPQVVFAHFWLKQFHYGPFEWLWRCCTYLSFNVPMVRISFLQKQANS